MLDLTRHYLFDGGMGTMLQESGLPAGEKPELFTLVHPEIVRQIHAAYVEAGADIITTNTFGANRRKLGCDPAPYITAAVHLAREARAPLVALDIGPSGAMLQPMGAMTFDEAYHLFAEEISAGVQAGADLVLIETMSDLLEAKAALLAARENCSLPVFVTMTFGEDGRTFLGTEPKTAAITLTSLGADAVGINCSLGPRELLPLVRQLRQYTHLPIIVQPNAGIPRLENGETVFTVSPEEFAHYGEIFLNEGAAILGGCCGTTAAHISALKAKMAGRRPAQRQKDNLCRLTGWKTVVELGESSIALVGERINPTGRKKLKEALRQKNYSYVSELAIAQEQEGAELLLVNAGLPDINEQEALPAMVQAVQRVSPLPVVIDSSDPVAMENALRVYSGRPLLNSVNGKSDCMASILPLAAKYGAAIVALTLNEAGISPDPSVRRQVAEEIVAAGERLGIPREDFLIDCLTMAVSANQNEGMTTIEAVKQCRQAGLKTILGISNISHGLPDRDSLNVMFFSAALSAGLNAGIINTASQRMMVTAAAAKVILGIDRNAAAYIAAHSQASPAAAVEVCADSLGGLIIKGVKSEIPARVEALLQSTDPLQVINSHIIPALDEAGARYESGQMFLPQLMASAEAAKSAFTVISRFLPEGMEKKGTIILATVMGDVHDIGKNIVKMLLENYGYRIVDLGRDVAPETVVEAAIRENAPLVGLSALMTTTAKNIAVTIHALKEAGANCRIMVGGAVITQEFAQQVGADFYGKDAAESARYAAEVFSEQ